MMLRIIIIAITLMLISPMAQAAVYIVSVGNNLGDREDAPLRYAERDALAFSTLMRNLGGASPEHAILVQGAGANDLRRTLLETNRRIRQAQSRGKHHNTLVVFYSGHADNSGLHMNGSKLPYDELRALVESSPAAARVLILDSCRSGGLTRVKGAEGVEAFSISAENRVQAEGIAVITSSSAWEDSHESERLKGSFFSHHLLTGLQGAADHDRDATVTLSEVYSYAYRQTLRSSGRTRSLQHPTYSYDIKGKGDLTLTRLSARSRESAELIFSEPGLYLVLRGGEGGELVNEVMVDAKGTALAMRPGSYFIQRRDSDHYREYSTELSADSRVDVSSLPNRKVEYARLIRKGHESLKSQHTVFAQVGARDATLDGMSITPQWVLGYNIDLPWITLGLRGRFSSTNTLADDDVLSTETGEVAVGATAQRFFDLQAISFGAGFILELSHVNQKFTTTGKAPNRSSLTSAFGTILTAQYALDNQAVIHLEGGPWIQFQRVGDTQAGAVIDEDLDSFLIWWLGAGVGWRL